MHSAVRVLLLEDSKADAELIEREVHASLPDVSFCHVADRRDFVDAMASFDPQLVLSDNQLPSIDALQALDVVTDIRPGTPFIVISGTVGEERAVEMLRSGVTDYVLKGRLGRLGPVLHRALAEVEQRERMERAARAIREAEARFRRISERAPIGIFETDAELLYTYVNPRWSEITGVPIEHAVGRLMATVVGAPGVQRFMETVRGGEERSARFEFRYRDNPTRLLTVTSRVVRDATGGISGWVGTIADVTAESRAQAALAKARDQANEASAFKSHFLANMSHEIRTPMIGVIGMTDLLLETHLDAQQRDYVETVRSSGEALMEVINDILDFSKVEAGKLEIDSQEFQVERVVYDIVDLLCGNARAKGVELVVNIGDSVPSLVVGDPGRVRQVLTNLIGNSVKFTDKGHVMVKVCLREHRDDDLMLGFEVIDTGDGITAEQLDRIFDPFTQADKSTSRKYGGTGLGLAISNQLVNLMGGELWAVSEVGEGSTFSFTVRAGDEHHAETPVWANPDPELAGLRILVAGGPAVQQEVLVGYLERWGIEVEVVGVGLDAVERVTRAAEIGRPFAAVIVDRTLDSERVPRLAAALAEADLPVVEIADQLRSGGPRSGAAERPAVITKPIHRDQLRAVLHRLLGKSDVSPEPESQEVAPAALRTDSSVGYVLLAEDNLINQKVTVAMLSSAGYRVDSVRDGTSAVEAAAGRQYDAILMDGQMPGLSGYEATAVIRDREGHGRHTPIIALTAAAREEDRERCLAAGMDDFISKPVSKESLLSTLGAVLRRAKQTG